jgi:hypothetical protein
MARGTTACGPVPAPSLSRCKYSLIARAQIGAFVGLLKASLDLLQLVFVPVSENVFACIFHGDRAQRVGGALPYSPANSKRRHVSATYLLCWQSLHQPCLLCCGAMS